MLHPSKPALKLPNCPMCKNPAVPQHKPFCSATCRNRDMHKWFTNAYALPADTGEEEDERLNDPSSEAEE
jgi:uncharacterized protein